jgi:predicted nucleotidyltransferase
VIAELALSAGVRRYLDELVSALQATVALEAAYLHGSAARGALDPETSDLDVYAVVARELTEAEKRNVRRRVAALRAPAGQLELVVYTRAQAATAVPRYELNTGDPAEDAFWFVLDRAAAEQNAVALVGPPWADVFAPVARRDVLAALLEGLDWQDRHEPTSRSSVLNACRSWAWLETGRWLSKPEAAAWLRQRVREQAEAAR